MIHWQHYYQQHKDKKPIQTIVEEYQRLLHEFTETRISITQATSIGGGGGDALELIPININRVFGWDVYGGESDVAGTLDEFKLIPAENITLLDFSYGGQNFDDIKNLDTYTNMAYLLIGDQAIPNLNDRLQNLNELEVIDYQYNTSPTTLNLSGMPKLTTAFIYYDSLTELNVKNNRSLSVLEISNTPLTSLDLTKNINLTLFYLTNTESTAEIDFSKNINLESLSMIFISNIPVINTSTLTKLQALYVYNNYGSVTGIDVSNNIKLTRIDLDNNLLSTETVNQILIDVDSFPFISTGFTKFVSLAGNSSPDGLGITAKDNLIGKGWTVITT
jgi:hypothetical protein